MSDSHGKFVWYELMTPDPKAAETFYRSAIGWGAQDAGMPDMSYTLLTAGPIPVAGLMETPQRILDAGASAFWTGYVYVDDVDATVAQAEKEGSAVHHPPDDIPGVGRFAVIADPQGAAIALFKTEKMTPADAPPPARPGPAAGTSSMPAISTRPSRSIRSCSAGPRPTPWTWDRWAPTSCSPCAAATRSAA